MHSTIGSTVHSIPLNSLEHCICTTAMTNIRPDRDSNLVHPVYKPQSIRMSHRGRPETIMSGRCAQQTRRVGPMPNAKVFKFLCCAFTSQARYKDEIPVLLIFDMVVNN